MTSKPIEIFRRSWQKMLVAIGCVLIFSYVLVSIFLQLTTKVETISLWVLPFFLLLALVCLFLMIISLLYFFKTLFTKYAFYENDAIFTIPNWRGFLPLFPYRKLHLSYDEIKTVEQRCEIYSFMGLPLFAPYVTSIFTADLEQQTISYDLRSKLIKGLDKNFAYQLARKSGRPLADQGTVGPRELKEMLATGAAPWTEKPIAPQELRTIKQKLIRNQWFVWIAFGLIFFITLMKLH